MGASCLLPTHNRSTPDNMDRRDKEKKDEKDGEEDEVDDDEEGEDIVSKLFNFDLYEALQIVFLSLDSISLKRARCVCHTWDNFIRKALWSSRPARRRLRARLVSQWKVKQPRVRVVDTNFTGVNFLSADNQVVVCGYTRDAIARVFSLPDGDLLHLLKCVPEGTRLGFCGGQVQLDMSSKLIATVADQQHIGYFGEVGEGDVVSVWEKKTGSLLYQGRPHGKGVSVMGLAIEGDSILSGGGNGRLCRIGEEKGEWAVQEVLEGNGREVTHLDVRGRWGVVGNRREALLWDLQARKIDEQVKPVPVKVWMVCLMHPYVFLVGGDDWEGLQVWQMVEHRMVRWVLKDFNLHNVHLSKTFLTVSELNDISDPENKECVTVVLDVHDLVDESVKMSELWSRMFTFNPGENRENQINAVTNDTSLIVSHDNFISILDFWNE